MFKRVLAVLAVPAVAAFVAVGAAGAASASLSPGTTGPGSWSFDPGTGSNAIQTAHTTQNTSTTTSYQAQVQQPINPNGTSVWPAKKGVIPVQFYLQQATDTKTTTTTTDAVYPDTLTSDASVPYTNLGVVPAGSFTLADVNNLTANFNWQVGHNECGTMRWQIDTPGGKNVYVYYGDAGTSFQTGTGQSGDNLAQLTTPAVDDSNLVGGYSVTTWANVLSAYGSVPVTRVALITDSYGCNGTHQQVQLTGTATVGLGAETDTYTPGTVAGSSSSTDTLSPWANTTSPAMFIDITKGSASDPGTVDETTYTGVGDTSGQFAVVDGKYKYNLSNNLSTGTYNVFMTPGTDAQRIPVSNSPTGAATFVLK